MSIDINAPEVQEAIKAAVKEATAGLAAKRDELLNELKEARKGKTIEPAELERRDARIAELEGQLNEATKAAGESKKAADKAAKALETEAKFVQSLLVENGLSDALVKAGVKQPAHLKAVKAMLSGQVQIVADGEARVAKVGDKALGDFITEWAKSDEGKFFVEAPANNGGGAGGGSGSQNNGEKLPDIKTSGAGISAADKAARTKAIQARLDKAGATTD